MWIFTCNWVLLVACFTSVLDYFFPLCYTQPGVLHVSPLVGLLFWSSFKGLYISVCWGIHLDILILYHQNHLHCLLSLSVTVCLCLSARSDAVGVFVKHVVPGSAADQSGNIRIHDRLIAVRTCCLIRVVPAGLLFLSSPPDISTCLSLQLDGVSLHGLTNQEVLEVMKRTGQTVVLSVVRKKPRGLERSLDKGIYLFFLQEPRQRHIRGSFLCHVETILDLEALGPWGSGPQNIYLVGDPVWAQLEDSVTENRSADHDCVCRAALQTTTAHVKQ